MFILGFSTLANGQEKVMSVNEKLDEFVNVRDFCISAKQDEMYFTIQSPSQEISQIAFMKRVNDKWTEPKFVDFSSAFSDLEPFLSPDQKRLYFVSDRPIDATSTTKKDFDIWFVSRQHVSENWSSPVNLGSPVNSAHNEFYPSVAANGNLYFTSDMPGGMGKDDIYFCVWDKTTYQSPKRLDGVINSDGYEFNAYISSDESFILYTKYNSSGGLGSGDLYISTKANDGKWSAAKNLGTPINTKFMEYCPFYDQPSETLYFTSKRDDLINRKFNDIFDFKKYVSGTGNGLSRIYKCKLTIPKQN